MTAPRWTPMRWPSAWKDPALLALIQSSPIDHLLVDQGDEFEPVRAAARQQSLQVAAPAAPPDGVTILKGEWPGVRMARGPAAAGAGPTGVPWVDSNGWAIRLEAACHPQAAVWVDAPPSGNLRTNANSYMLAMADSAAHGGRWILSLDPNLAAGLAAAKPKAAAVWKQIAATAAFFADHKDWNAWEPAAVAAVISDFAGPNEFFSHEMLNLLARAGLHYRILRKDSLRALTGLEAVIYPDTDAPSAEIRKLVSGFVRAGGLLIAGPSWGAPEGTPQRAGHPRYTSHALGKGRIAIAIAAPDDPYEMAQDAVILISHRYDLVRFWNGGATGSYYAVSPDGKQAVTHLFFYANWPPDAASVRVAGPYRKVKISTPGRPEIPAVHVELQKDALEVHLPMVPPYVALELS